MENSAEFKITDKIFENILEIMKTLKSDGLVNKVGSINNNQYCWVTSYQLAIIYDNEIEKVPIPLGGENSGKTKTFADLIANRFANEYDKNPHRCHFEYSQMTNKNLKNMSFSKQINSSVCDKNINLYRYKD